MKYINRNQTEVFTKVHQLVINIIFRDLDIDSVMDKLNDLYQSFMYHYEADEGLVYLKPIDIFFRNAQRIVGDQYPDEVIWEHNNVSELIDILMYYKREVERERSVLIYQERQNKKALDEYITKLTHHYARLLFVRIDLKYAQGHDQLITIEEFNEHINKLRQLIRKQRACFKDLEGHAWALEQGEINGGLHCHLLLIYDGSERQKDWHIAKEVGEKWVQITEGYGTYYNYHESKNKRRYQQYDRLGIGMIHRDNELEVANARCTALYLTKPDKFDQHLKVKILGMNTFGKGRYRTHKRRGLPPISK